MIEKVLGARMIDAIHAVEQVNLSMRPHSANLPMKQSVHRALHVKQFVMPTGRCMGNVKIKLYQNFPRVYIITGHGPHIFLSIFIVCKSSV